MCCLRYLSATLDPRGIQSNSFKIVECENIFRKCFKNKASVKQWLTIKLGLTKFQLKTFERRLMYIFPRYYQNHKSYWKHAFVSDSYTDTEQYKKRGIGVVLLQSLIKVTI